MVVFLDVEQGKIKIYDKDGIEEYFFDEIDDAALKIGEQQFLYVTNAIRTNAENLVDLVGELTYQGHQNQYGAGVALDDSDTLYLQSCASGVLVIEDIGVKFEGQGDCKEIDEEIYDLMQESTVLRSLLKSGKVKVVDYRTMINSSRKQDRIRRQFMKKRSDQEEKELNEIIMNTNYPGGARAMAERGLSEQKYASDVDETDITNDIIEEEERMKSMSQEEINKAVQEGRLAV